MSKLRDYKIVFKQGAIQPLDLAVEGDFVMIRNVISKGAIPFYDVCCDIRVLVEFDDQGKVGLRAREGTKRPYQRLRLTPVDDAGNIITIPSDIEVNLVAGSGDFYTQREHERIPDKIVTVVIGVAAGSEVTLTNSAIGIPNSLLSFREIRLRIPSTEAGGLWFGGVAGNTNAWLEKGVVEWLEYTGSLVLRNSGASLVSISIATIQRKD